jgi:nuclear transport factor 2 (NTF2) superfamily protein
MVHATARPESPAIAKDRHMAESRPPLPPFTEETAIQKVRAAENGWNTCNAEAVARAYTSDSKWRNRDQFLQGRPAIVDFLTNKWQRELEYRLIKEIWAFGSHRIAVRFAYEWHDAAGDWFRSYGNENWEFDEAGLMRTRHASINDLPISHSERLFKWDRAAPRPVTHGSLTDLGL